MTTLPSYFLILTLSVASIKFFALTHSSYALGSGATLAVVSDGSATVCGIVAGEPTQRIECYHGGNIITVPPNVSFASISGGSRYFCGLRSGNYSLLCWNSTFQPKRLYNNYSVLLENLSIGDTHICSTLVGNGKVECWRKNRGFQLPPFGYSQFASISSGFGFSCGILRNNSRVRCWGNMPIASEIESEFVNISMSSLVAGDSHVCGLDSNGFLVCKGSNSSGQLEVPESDEPLEYSGLALGAEHSCAIRSSNGSVVCWGGRGQFSVNVTEGVSFEVIVSGSNFSCGVTRSNFSVMCWGPGWPTTSGPHLPLRPILPGPCVQSSCIECGIYPQSQNLCSGFGKICKPCLPHISPSLRLLPPSLPPLPLPPPPLSPLSSPSKTLTRALLIFAMVGLVGIIAGICTIMYCLWSCGEKKIHNSVQPTITRSGSSSRGGGSFSSYSNNSISQVPSRSSSSITRRQGSFLLMRRQRSGTSSSYATTTKHTEAEEFTLAELASATNNFSPQNVIGAGSYGVVYRGKLPDGRDVAVKRGENKKRKFQEEAKTAFESEIAFLSRLHHKHLVSLVGFCEDEEERLLVYEYMKNGALHDHLHNRNSSFLNSWRMRIKIALDASRGIEYLHNYAVPPIIHRDIKSSNILLDANWTGRVSDFGLSLMGAPETEQEQSAMKAAGTMGYIDPEYYSLNVLTTKSDVYGFGVVLLELLTGRRAVFKNGEEGGRTVSLTEYAVPAIMAGEMERVLDRRVGAPAAVNEAEAVELVGYTAMLCVNLEGKDRPTMSDVVGNLDRALALCDSAARARARAPAQAQAQAQARAYVPAHGNDKDDGDGDTSSSFISDSD
ncbi:putative serine/threonine-protein kinase-like protein CCR3 [Senna tora]|uniref:non-specific serine/threonine protein kinase n=1 Tax=Senna tora TaxID=362788 RepID=A0A834WGS4_9FABA|nr:putative serine/threonine-protein kinase-like protein CCR3 [Senna tora]